MIRGFRTGKEGKKKPAGRKRGVPNKLDGDDRHDGTNECGIVQIPKLFREIEYRPEKSRGTYRFAHAFLIFPDEEAEKIEAGSGERQGAGDAPPASGR